MIKVALKRNRNTHSGLIIKAALVLIAAIMLVWGLSYYSPMTAAAGNIIAPAADEIPALVSGGTGSTEAARCSLGSIQRDSILRAAPGDELNTGIDFYNVDGNLTTYITLAVAEAPEGWEIQIDPELTLDVTGVLGEPVDQLEEGKTSVLLGDRGYAVARTSCIKITVPQDIEAGTTAKIVITAKAEWHGQTGQAVICQTRDFNYSVEVV